MTKKQDVLIIGATGFLGGKVAHEAVARGHSVRALVRKGTDASALERKGIKIFRGDMLDMASVSAAMAGCDAVITTAAGYTSRRSGDFKSETDTKGNENLARAACVAKIKRYVLCSVLTCDEAQSVPHFWNKKLAEDALVQAGVPFIALRPGAFLDQGPGDFWAAGLKKGKLNFLASPSVPVTFVHPDDVARDLVSALDIEIKQTALRIDIGADRTASINDIAKIMGELLGRPVKVSVPPWPLVYAGLSVVGMFRPQMHDMRQMMAYIQSGNYVADTSLQAQLLGKVPTLRSGIVKYLSDAGLT